MCVALKNTHSHFVEVTSQRFAQIVLMMVKKSYPREKPGHHYTDIAMSVKEKNTIAGVTKACQSERIIRLVSAVVLC